MNLKKFAIRGIMSLAIFVALCMFFSGTVRTITTPKVRLTAAKRGKLEERVTCACKVAFPDVAFQFRAGYIFIILVTFFILVSYLDRKYVSCEQPSEGDQKKMLLWAKVLGITGVVMIVCAAIVTALGAMNPGADPDTNFIAYLNDIGFQAFIFFGVLVGCNAVWLYSNAKDQQRDKKALPINLNLFSTTRGYTYGTIGICLITFLLYKRVSPLIHSFRDKERKTKAE